MHRLLNVRFALYAVAAVLAVFGVSNAFVAMFVQARHEVVYQFEVTVSHCARGQCAYSAMLEVANTGREAQQDVAVTIAGLPRDVGAAPYVLNLDASFPRASDPEIEQGREGEVLTVRLRRFMPGTLVQFMLQGFFPERELQHVLEPGVSVSGRGRMIEGDPRGIAIGRLFGRLSGAGVEAA